MTYQTNMMDKISTKYLKIGENRTYIKLFKVWKWLQLKRYSANLTHEDQFKKSETDLHKFKSEFASKSTHKQFMNAF